MGKSVLQILFDFLQLLGVNEIYQNNVLEIICDMLISNKTKLKQQFSKQIYFNQ